MSFKSTGLIFDEIPTLYERYRPGYPSLAIETLLELSRVPPGGDVIEIGPGTGQLTVPLAARGFVITAVEPGPRLAAFLARRLEPFLEAKVIGSRFEDADIPACSFDLVTSATAFHWVDPDSRYELAARALRATGALALIRNDHVQGHGNVRYYQRAAEIYRRHAPMIGPPFEPPTEANVPGFRTEMTQSRVFNVVEERRFAWDQPYSTRTLIGLLRTYSNHRDLPGTVRAALFRDIRSLIDTELGGSFVDRYVTTVCVGRKRRLAR